MTAVVRNRAFLVEEEVTHVHLDLNIANDRHGKA